ncbi:hypothetical protein BDV26DRAFT_274704 [Aspergillus bertholletiae]|uniref:Uncharacterized protein n=1 Tax=Aspergillus bertholletiae TaxID=1226010 RepID=A0A5N7AQY5_9EURO|nr:hypothetical protein BDV26DRAFT_274704 [Aspergillus bertholletiae]
MIEQRIHSLLYAALVRSSPSPMDNAAGITPITITVASRLREGRLESTCLFSRTPSSPSVNEVLAMAFSACNPKFFISPPWISSGTTRVDVDCCHNPVVPCFAHLDRSLGCFPSFPSFLDLVRLASDGHLACNRSSFSCSFRAYRNLLRLG